MLPKKVSRELANDDDRSTVIAECHAVLEASYPAPLDAFGQQIERLFLHYPEKRLTEGEFALVKRDWRRLLGEVPADILAQAVDDYLMSPARFSPTPGQLNEHIKPMLAYRRGLAKRARETMDMINGVADRKAVA